MKQQSKHKQVTRTLTTLGESRNLGCKSRDERERAFGRRHGYCSFPSSHAFCPVVAIDLTEKMAGEDLRSCVSTTGIRAEEGTASMIFENGLRNVEGVEFCQCLSIRNRRYFSEISLHLLSDIVV